MSEDLDVDMDESNDQPAIYLLSEDIAFPPADLAGEGGLLAVGGDLSRERLLLAYSMGIFPWPHGKHLLWFSPDPRCLLFPDKVHVTDSMSRILRGDRFAITFDKDFSRVIRSCRTSLRGGETETWITRDMIKAYTGLHEQGYAHSVEAWQEDKLVGGLYGLSLGGAFFGESMFKHVSNASKACFITLSRQVQEWGFDFIDCQLPTDHLISLGAQPMPRAEFLPRLEKTLEKDTRKGSWG